jgi:ribosomal protein S18 acetylase RimI-like enzyme
MVTGLPDFTVGYEPVITPALLKERGFSLRVACSSDLAFLRRLYGEFRADEMRYVPWPEAAKHAFLDSQFELQHRHYMTHFEQADFLVIEHEGTPIGRFYLQKGPADFLIVDIGLLPAWRGKQLGSMLIGESQRLAREANMDGIRLHVDQCNVSARRLYERLGFVVTEPDAPYIGMRWPSFS